MMIEFLGEEIQKVQTAQAKAPAVQVKDLDRIVGEAIARLANNPAPEAFGALAAAAGALNLSPRNRLVAGAQLAAAGMPAARALRTRAGWERRGVVVPPQARGVHVVTPSGEGGWTTCVVHPNYEVGVEVEPLLPEEVVLEVLGEEEDLKRAIARFALREAGASSQKLWEDVKVTLGWGALKASEVALGLDLGLEAPPPKVLVGAFGRRPQVLKDLVMRAAKAADALADRLGLKGLRD